LKSQDVISSGKWGGRRTPPRVYTERGVVMAATMLKTPQAVDATHYLIEVFVAARRAQREGSNQPTDITPVEVTSAGLGGLGGLAVKIRTTISRILDAIADPERETTIRDEANTLLRAGLDHLKARMDKAVLDNELQAAEIAKILAETERIRAEAAITQADARHRELALLAKQLILVLETQAFLETGNAESLLATLRSFDPKP